MADREYLIRMNETQVDVLIVALDLFARIQIGQLDRIADKMTLFYSTESSDRIKHHLDELKKLFFPMLVENQSLSIGGPQTTMSAKICYDIEQILRFRLAWDRNPGGGQGVHYYDPHLVSNEPPPFITGIQP